jgi:arginyl-tRNA synthetase
LTLRNRERKKDRALPSSASAERTGSTTYLLRDIAAVFDREETYKFDKMIYVVMAQQDSHFREAFKAIELMGQLDVKNKLQHLSFGRIQGIQDHLQDAHLLGGLLDGTAVPIYAALMANGSDGANDLGVDAVTVLTAINALIAQDMAQKPS